MYIANPDAEIVTDPLSFGTFIESDAFPRAPDSGSSDCPSPDLTKPVSRFCNIGKKDPPSFALRV